ncbi:tyrosine-type recombinase/integrase [Domibacillus indicus]|uniref:tyrosine-type recombinase/integrase n=1 Tax=Domibacillus indicus TaxID=1437523 RepID=UPI002040C691|nr:tyrosine-type recombinase/integrase [Domibacillus indicus]MCM3789474.1 tyrosine-type recombinase/integrase [Domibacillus indicus]
MSSYIVLDKKNPADKSELPRIKITVELGYDERGKRIRRKKTVSLKTLSDRAIKKAITEFEIEVATSGPVDTNNLKYREAVALWLENHVSHLSFQSQKAYEQNIQPAVEFFGDIKLKDLKKFHIVEFMNHLTALDEKSADYKMKMNRLMLQKMVEWDLMSENVAATVKKKKEARKEMLFYSEQEVKQLFELLEEAMPKHRLVIKMAVLSGMRLGEILGLTMENVNFSDNTITVKHTLVHDTKKDIYYLGAPKNKKKRIIPMPADYMAELRGYIKEVKKNRLAYGSEWRGIEGMDLIFCRPDGYPHLPQSFLKYFHTFTENHGMKRIRFHDLRHTHASLLLSKGVNIKVIQERMGHSTITLTIDTYSHLTKENEQEAVTKLTSIF